MRKLLIRTHRLPKRFVYIILDNKDYFACSIKMWRLDTTGRIIRRVRLKGKVWEISLARELLSIKDRSKIVFHKNFNKLDFRRRNLGICTQAENSRRAGSRPKTKRVRS